MKFEDFTPRYEEEEANEVENVNFEEMRLEEMMETLTKQGAIQDQENSLEAFTKAKIQKGNDLITIWKEGKLSNINIPKGDFGTLQGFLERLAI